MTHTEALFHVLLSMGIFIFTPLTLGYGRLFPVSRVVCLFSILGVYAMAGPLLPQSLPLWSIWLVVMTGVLCVRHYRAGGREPFADCLHFWPVPLILILGFGLCLFRWDPPGAESAFIGAAARRVAEGAPFTIGTQGGTVSLLVAMGHLGHWAPVERLVAFFTAVGAVAFAFSISSALGLWFQRTPAFVGGLIAMAIFSAPQVLLASGAAPVFFGLTSGLCVLELSKLILVRDATRWQRGLYAVAVSFGAYCDPTAHLVSLVVCFPALLWAYFVCDSQRRFARNLFGMVLFALPMVIPAYVWGRFNEFYMLPHGDWPLALVVSLGLGAVSFWADRKARYRVPAIFCLLTAGTLAALGEYGILPMSIQRAAEGMAVFALAMPGAWLVETFLAEWRKTARAWEVAGFAVLFFIALHQFHVHLGPEFTSPQLSSKDREAMAYVQSYLPEGQCIHVDPRYSGRWIPTMANRCIVTDRKIAQWAFLADGQPRPALLGADPVFDGGALVYRMGENLLNPQMEEAEAPAPVPEQTPQATEE